MIAKGPRLMNIWRTMRSSWMSHESHEMRKILNCISTCFVSLSFPPWRRSPWECCSRTPCWEALRTWRSDLQACQPWDCDMWLPGTQLQSVCVSVKNWWQERTNLFYLPWGSTQRERSIFPTSCETTVRPLFFDVMVILRGTLVTSVASATIV